MIIEGTCSTFHYPREVTIDGGLLDPAPAHTFTWGYGGSGPAQLALAILLAADLPPWRAQAYHKRFAAQFIAPLSRASFRIEVDVMKWIAENESTTGIPTEESQP